MRIKTLSVTTPIVIGMVAVFFSGCNRNSVKLDYTNAKGEVPQLGNLVFRFSNSLVKDSMLNQWDSTEYISFEPSIKGRFRWESPDQLVFSPSTQLMAATAYKAKIGREVLRYSKYGAIKYDDGINFHTPALTLDNAQVTWVLQDEQSRMPVPQVDLYFNYRINPNELKDKLKIEVDGKPMQHSLQTLSADNKISVRINGLSKIEDRNYDAKIIIDKGLKPEDGTNVTTDALTSSLSIPSPYVLTIQNMESEHDGTDGVVTVTTSQQLTGENLSSFIKFEPQIKYTTELTDNGFMIRSSGFDVEKSYALTIEQGLRGKIGGVLKEEYNGSVAFGELEANIAFTNSKAVYLSKQGGKNIEVKITNVPKVKIVISKIYESNLLVSNRYGYYPRETRGSGDDEGDNEYNYDYDYASNRDEATMGDVIYEKEVDTRSLPKSGAGRILNFSQFEDRLPDFKGIYHVMIRSTKDYWVRDSRFISLSDIGLIAKQGEDKIFVFTNSIKTTNAVDGVNIFLYANNNQLIGTGATNADGVAEISYRKKDFSGFRPAMVIAKTADDFNYLPFNNTAVNTSRFDVGGKRNNTTGLDAFIYEERDIYRPGEKINFSVIIRDRQWKSPGDIPVKLKFLLPNGKELKSFRKNLNEEGSVEGTIPIDISAITGSYSLEVYTSNDVLLGSKNFMIEEFVPDRIKVNTKLDKNFLKPGESTSLDISAMNFFGPPAANRNYECEIQVKQKYFSPEKFNDYDFSLANPNTTIEKQIKEGKTDADGHASESFTLDKMYANNGLLQANFYTTVFDETGRPVSRTSAVDLVTQDVFFGIKEDWFYYYALNQPVKFQLAAVNKDGNEVNSTAKVQVIKHEYKTVLARSGSYFRYESQKEDKLMIENQVSVGNNAVYSYIPRSPGDYELRVYRPGSNSYVKRSFYSYGSWSWGDNSSFEVNNEGHVDIELDKKSYYSGETVKALFKTPFSGRLLVTTETDHVLSYQYVNVDKRTASVELKMSGDDVPNVYVTATLIKPHDVSDIPLTVAHGFMNVKVEEKSRDMPVEIAAQKSVRSRTHQKVKVKAVPGSFITLAAVDNGVLQVSDFKTPDPYDYFYQKKALQVDAYDLYPLLFPEVKAKLSSTGGDADLEMKKRVNPMPAKRIKILSYWSGIAKANGSGEANFEFDIPQFSGEVRLMAVAYKDQSFGSSENTMKVADPIVISTALPRFLSPGDTVTVPVTLSNTTSKATNVSADLKVSGPLKIIGGNNQSLSLNANSEGRATFQVVADPAIAVGKISVVVNGLGEKFSDETEISVRPPSTLQKMSGSGSIAGGGTQQVTINTSDFIPGSINYQLVIGRSPALELIDHLRYLVEYPYGCTEQTVSAAFPQLYYGDLADLAGLNQKQNKLNANTNIIEAIRKIKMRQLYNGAVTLWDNEDREDWWATIYAAHFLLEARKAGFDVDNSLIETMLSYIATKLKNRELIIYYYNRNQNRRIAPKEVSYGLYVLALAGRSNISAMNYYKSTQGILALDSKYLLASAYAIAGDKKSFSAMLPTSFSGEESVPQTGGSYYSDIRDEAIALNALIDVDPANSQIGTMAKHVSDKLKNRYWISTQERAFAFLALGKLARNANKSDVTGEVKVNGKTIANVSKGWKGDASLLKGNNIQIETKGNGRLYYYWQSEGISASGKYKEEDNYIRVRKRFYDRFGNPLTGNTFKQNELIIVGISLENAYTTAVENIVITDLLPAGFEIENPRTKEIPGMDWIKNMDEPTALDVRDDRIHFFVDLRFYRPQKYYYAVRAVSPGVYKMGPVSADAMYNGEYHSYNGAGVVRVIQ